MNASVAPLRLALIGNPNSGKTALFNLLTGSRQKVANYAGVTVERKEGRVRTPLGRGAGGARPAGAYSLHPASPDEAIARDVCRGFYPGEPAPDLLVCGRRHQPAPAPALRAELRELGRPMIVALNQSDAAERRGIRIDADALARELGVPVLSTVAVAPRRRAGAGRGDRPRRRTPAPADAHA